MPFRPIGSFISVVFVSSLLGMPRYDQHSAECLVFTYKEGLLAPVAHDLKIRVGKFSISIGNESEISATFDPASLEVVCAMENGIEKENCLSKRDCAQIEKNIVRDVLRVKKYPDIRFQSSHATQQPGGYRVGGDITICGITRGIQTVARRHGDKVKAEIELHQPDFGIKPFKALMGTLKVAANLRVELIIPAEGA